MTSTLYDQNYHPLAFPLPSSLPPPLFCFSVSCLASQPFCMHALFPLINTAPGVRSDHLIGAPPYLTANNQLCLCPYSSLRHWQPCIPFRLPSTYTRPPYPGATPSFNPPHCRRSLAPAALVVVALSVCEPHFIRVPGPRSAGDLSQQPSLLSRGPMQMRWAPPRAPLGPPAPPRCPAARLPQE